MFFIDILFALAVALLLTALFDRGFRNRGPWTSLWVFFLLIFLASWAGGLWVTPVGPPLFGIYWLPFVFVGIIFALLIAAAAPARPPRSRAEAIERARAQEEVSEALSVFFWVWIIGLLLVIVLAYIV